MTAKEIRIKDANDTLAILQKGTYTTYSGTVIDISSAVKDSIINSVYYDDIMYNHKLKQLKLQRPF